MSNSSDLSYFDSKKQFMKNTQFIYNMFSLGVNVVPFIAGNLLDLIFLGSTKNLVNVTPLMKNNFFGFSPTASKINDENNRVLDNGFAGLFRFVTATILELPIKACSIVLSAALYMINHFVIKPLVLLGVALCIPISNNFCESRPENF